MNEAQQKRTDEVVEELARFLYERHYPRMYTTFRELATRYQNSAEGLRQEARKILSIKDIYVADPDQKYPEFLTLAGLTEMELVNATRKSLTDNGFIKVIKEGE